MTFVVLSPLLLAWNAQTIGHEFLIASERQGELHQVGAHPENAGDKLIRDDCPLLNVLEIGELLESP